MKLLFCTLLVSFSVSMVPAQSLQQKVDVLNCYASFMNAAVEPLSFVFNELEGFNTTFIEYAEGREDLMRIQNREKFKREEEYLAYKERFKGLCTGGIGVLPTSEQEFFIVHSGAMSRVVNEIIDVRNRIAFYVGKQEFKADSSYAYAKNLLDTAALLYLEFDQIKEEQAKKVSQLGTLYSLQMGTDPISKVVRNHLKPLLANVKLVLEGVKGSNYAVATQASVALKDQLASLAKNREAILAEVPRGASGSRDNSYYLFENIVEQAAAINFMAGNFLKDKKLAGVPVTKTLGYAYYNYKLLDMYDQHSNGLLALCNRFMAGSKVLMPLAVGEPNTFTVQYPEFYTDRSLPKLKEEPEPVLVDSVMQPEVPAVAVVAEKTKAIVAVEESVVIEPDSSSLQGFLPNNMVLLLDVSSSMNAPDKLPVLKDAFTKLVNLMRPEDYVAIVSYSGKANIELEPTSAQSKQIIISAIDSISSGGGTNILRGLRLSQEVAQNNFMGEGNNKVILATDGSFDNNRALARIVAQMQRGQVSLTIFYLSRFENRTVARRLKDLASKANGNYCHITTENASQVLLREAQALGRGN